MTLQLSKGRPYKAYVKKLENGFGIKTINTCTGVENILMITADSTKSSQSEKKVVDSQRQILIPLMSKFSKEMVSATLSIPSTNRPNNNAINEVLVELEPYLREIKPDIAGFHIFEEGNTKSSPNVQKASVIFVANTEMARKKGVHFNIPGHLVNVFFVDGQNEEGKIKFKADSVVKPLTIVVSDYVLHINICYDLPSKTQIRTVATQTKKRYVLSSSVDENKPIYKIESLLLSDLQVKPEQKCTQTDRSILAEEPLLFQNNPLQHYQDSSIHTVYMKNQISYASLSSSDKKCVSCGDESGLNTDEDNTKTESFENSSKQTVDCENSLSSFTSYDSHSHLYQKAAIDHVKDENVHKLATIENKENTRNKGQATFNRNKEQKTLTIFDNSSNYNTKITSSDNVLENVQPKYYRNSTVCTSTQSKYLEEDRSEASVKTEHSDSGLIQLKNTRSISNVSIKDIKERLNKTTLSLQQLYSVIELLEKKSVYRSSCETVSQAADIEREQPKNNLSRQTSKVMSLTSQAALEESISDQCQYVQEMSLKSEPSNRTDDYEQSFNHYTDTSFSEILCERCGSFHNHFGSEGDCKMFSKKSMKLLETEDGQDTVNSGSSISQGNLSKNVCSIASILQDETESCESSNNFSIKTQSSLETNIKDSTKLYNDQNYFTMDESSQYKNSRTEKESILFNTDKDNLDNGAMSITTEAQKIVVYPEESNQKLNDQNSKYIIYKNKNHYRSDTEKYPEETFMNKKEFELEEISISDHNLADFDEHSIIEMNNSKTFSQDLTGLQDTLEESNENPSHSSILTIQNIELMDDDKEIDECNNVEHLKVSSTVLLPSQPNIFTHAKSTKSSNATDLRNENKTEAKEDKKILYFSEMRNNKSWISFKKSLRSLKLNKKLTLKGKTTNSEPINNKLKVKTLSSGDHLRENDFCKVSSSLQERLDTIGLFNNQSNFLKYKYSSSSTLHIVPSSQESCFQDKKCSNQTIATKVESNSSSFDKWFVKSQENCNQIEDKNVTCTTKYSRYFKFENTFLANKIDLKTTNRLKTAKNTTQNKYAKEKKPKSKLRKSKLFCFFI